MKNLISKLIIRLGLFLVYAYAKINPSYSIDLQVKGLKIYINGKLVVKDNKYSHIVIVKESEK